MARHITHKTVFKCPGYKQKGPDDEFTVLERMTRDALARGKNHFDMEGEPYFIIGGKAVHWSMVEPERMGMENKNEAHNTAPK